MSHKLSRKQRRRAERALRQSPPASTHAAGGAAPLSARATANLANAARSTGPRTPEGKARSRANALAHGLYARTLAPAGELLGEDPAAFGALHESLVAEYAPEGFHEERMVERLALLWWRLDRLTAYTQKRLAADLALRGDPGLAPGGPDRPPEGSDPVQALLASEAVTVAEGRLERAIARLHRDLLFLARYRARTRREDGRRETRHWVQDVEARLAAEEAALLQRIRVKRTAGVRQPGEPDTAPDGAEGHGAEAEAVEPPLDGSERAGTGEETGSRTAA